MVKVFPGIRCTSRRSCGRCRPAARGFTLIEIMVVVTVLAVLASLVAPSFRNMILSNRVATAASALQVSLNLARSEAVRRGADARVTIAANGAAGQWDNGWTVFVDRTTDANGGVAPVADDASVTRLEVVAPLDGVQFGQTGSLNYFSYNGLGRMVDVTGSTVTNRTFWFYVDTSDKQCLIINNTGRVRVVRVKSHESCPTS
ncbi:MAG: GspH/FimT family pseudopilin [Hylemonella sp.]